MHPVPIRVVGTIGLCGTVEPEESVCKLSEETPPSGPVLPDPLSIPINLSYHNSTMSRSMGATYCWGIPRGIVFGLGEVGDGTEGGRLRTRGLVAE